MDPLPQQISFRSAKRMKSMRTDIALTMLDILLLKAKDTIQDFNQDAFNLMPYKKDSLLLLLHFKTKNASKQNVVKITLRLKCLLGIKNLLLAINLIKS